MKKKTVQALSALGTMLVGAYMLYAHTWGTPPSVSGIGFLLAGFGMWVSHCPVCNFLFKK